jgi:hypothetical protein
MKEKAILMLIADPEMIGARSMTRITLKMAAWREGSRRIAGSRKNGGTTVSGSAGGQVSALMRCKGFKPIACRIELPGDFDGQATGCRQQVHSMTSALF